jgi:hypothetical protein
MIKPFLSQIASSFYAEYGAGIEDMVFIFPNRRSGLFFRKYLAEEAGKPLFAPAVYTINDLFVSLSGKQTADRIGMLFTLYNIYVRHASWEESFDEFVFWGEMLLNDFDDIDKYMANARMIFTNVTDLKEIDSGYDDLSDNQIAAIRTFWASFTPKSASLRNFQTVWQILYPMYVDFKASLAREGKGYEGMIFREVAENLDRYDADNKLPAYARWVFVGLNALSVAEEKLLAFFRRKGVADFYWDYSSPRVKDPDNKASLFAEANMQRFPSRLPLPDDGSLPDPIINVIGIPSAIGQAKQVYSILDSWAQNGEMQGDNAIKTAVVLPDEHMLVPTLNAIPESVENINVTMGYPPDGTPVAALMDFIPSLQKNAKYVNGKPHFYLRDALPLLNHRYIMAVDPPAVTALAREITMRKRMLVDAESLWQTDFLQQLFTIIDNAAQASDYLLQILQTLAQHIDNGMETEFIYHYHKIVNRMKEAMAESSESMEMTLPTYFRLLKRMAASIAIPFAGEPLAGLQIMGILETRALDFDRVIILSMNEGIFPQKRAASSFIPWNLRRGFGLPTYEHQDSVRAYHFYRLIHRAKHVTLIYDSRSGGLQTGEMSRFIHQLRYHYNAPLQTKWMAYNFAPSEKNAVARVAKTGTVMQRLLQYRSDPNLALSASAINAWLDCPLKFYFTIIEEIKEEDKLSDTIESNEFGSILHQVMEDMYRPLCNQLVTADLLSQLRNDKAAMTESVRRNYLAVRYKSDSEKPLAGQDYLAGEMIRKYAARILETDARHFTPFRYISSEEKITATIALPDGSRIRLKGFIDRVDSIAGKMRVVDYKSGRGETHFSSIESLFNPSEPDRRKAVMQVFMYAWMKLAALPGGQSPTPLQPVIYFMRAIFSDAFDPAVYIASGRNKERVDDFRPLLAPFEESLAGCLGNIFNPDIPFTRTPNGKACEWCGFKELCG